MKAYKKLQELHDKINISKRFPNYINRNIFRLGAILIFIFIGMIVYTYGYDTQWVYSTCDDHRGCFNPYMECQDHNFTNPFIDHNHCTYILSTECIGKNCDEYYIKQYDYFGTKPPKIVTDSKMIIFIMFLATIYINHLYYMLKKKDEKLQKL